MSRKLLVLTSGGDSPAMNATIYGFLAAAKAKGCSVYASIDGYKGLIDANFKELNLREFKKNIYLSGTAIGSSRCLAFKQEQVREAAIAGVRSHGFDSLFVIGGDGSYVGADLIRKIGFPVVAAPGTIDNDVSSSHYTIGYFSALEEIFQAIKKIKSTSESHSQVTFLEVMGRHCHDLSVAGAIAGGVDYVVTNKSPKTEDELFVVIDEMVKSGKRGIVIVVTEKVYGPEFGFNLPSLKDLCISLEKRVGRQVRFNVLGYTQRGAIPVAWDLFVAHNFGRKAFELLEKNVTGVAIGFDGHSYYTTPLETAVSMPKKTSNEYIDFIASLYKI